MNPSLTRLWPSRSPKNVLSCSPRCSCSSVSFPLPISHSPSFWVTCAPGAQALRVTGPGPVRRRPGSLAVAGRVVPAAVAARAPAAAERTAGSFTAALGRGRLRRQRLAGFDPLVAQHGLAAQPDPIAVHVDHLHQDLLAFLDLVLDFLDAMLGDLGDVEQAFHAGEDLDEGPEVGDAGDLAQVGLPDLRLGGDLLDDLDRLERRALVDRGDVDAPIVLDVD